MEEETHGVSLNYDIACQAKLVVMGRFSDMGLLEYMQLVQTIKSLVRQNIKEASGASFI